MGRDNLHKEVKEKYKKFLKRKGWPVANWGHYKERRKAMRVCIPVKCKNCGSYRVEFFQDERGWTKYNCLDCVYEGFVTEFRREVPEEAL